MFQIIMLGLPQMHFLHLTRLRLVSCMQDVNILIIMSSYGKQNRINPCLRRPQQVTCFLPAAQS